MLAVVLVVEPDISIRTYLASVIEETGREVVSCKAATLNETLSQYPEFQFVFWNGNRSFTNAQSQALKTRPESENWVLMKPIDWEATPSNTEQPQFTRTLLQPFRKADILAVLNDEPAPPEDATLKFLRKREKEFALFRKKESQLREAHRHQQELERMKNTFLSLVSHELRTPLTIISGNLHVLNKLAAKWENAMATECVCSAFEGSKRLSKLVDELLRFTVSVPQQRDRWDIGLTLRRVVGELQPLANNRGLMVQLNKLEKMELEGDPSGLPDALHQLIENALVFNQPGGKVEVSAGLGPNKQTVRIDVVDDGPGIERHELDKIFHPFYQVADVNTRTVEGLGIGLSLARRTIESHGGTLTLKSVVGTGTRATVTLPVRSLAAVALNPDRVLPDPPEGNDVNALKAYSQELYEFLETERVGRRHAEEQKRVLEQTFVETLISLIRMVDPRVSGGTFQGERVLDYARAVARHLDPTLLSRPEFLYGLLLYDIGKIGVAEAVLSKTGVLTEQEKVSAQAHAEIGAELLNSVGVLRPAIDAVRSHHERWDGSGYPDGLSGKDIPILARIIAVVDSFDAMTVDRPYREALTPAKAKQQIIDGAGTAFDPQVVSAFSRAWNEIEGHYNKAFSSRKSSLMS